MRCITVVLLTSMLIFSAVAASTYSSAEELAYITVGDFEYDITSSTTATVIDYTNDEESNVVIPAEIPGHTTYKVTAIDFDFTQECITSITIPETVQSMEAYCLDAPNLTTINVASGSSYFSSDSGILFNKNQSKLVKYPCGKTDSEYTVPNTVVEIGSFAFQKTNVERVIVNDTVVIIGNCAFYEASSLKEVVIPEMSSLTMISNNAFCKSGLTSIDLPWSLTFIGAYAFEDTGLSSVVIPTSLEHLGEGAFSDCSSLTAFKSNSSAYVVEDGVLFYVTSNVKTLVAYPSGKDVKEYTLPADTNNIGPYAFYGTNRLEKVVLNKNMTVVPEMAFYGCRSLTTVDLSNVSIIESGAFDSCEKLTGIEFSDKLNYIGHSSFSGTNIESIDIPSSVTYIGIVAFGNCMNLKEFTISESTKVTLTYGILSGSTNMQKITINSKDVVLDSYSLSIGTADHNKATVDVLVPSGYSIPADAAGDYTTLNVKYIGERPYPWVNIIGAIVCALGIIGILYGMRQV